MKFAYADPPYFGCGKKLYGKHHPEAAVWDSKKSHIDLIKRLVDEFSDGWALSCNPRDLAWLLPECPDDVRVCAWVKTFHQIRPTSVQHAWEPVILGGGRKLPKRNPMVRDWMIGNATRQRGLPGAKSAQFNRWVLDLLGFQDGDEIVDLFPGTGGMAAEASQLVIA